jgi:hypothetical protein
LTDIHQPIRSLLGLTRYAVIVPAVAAIIGALLLMAQGSIEMMMVVFVGVFVDSNRAGEVISYGVGAGALVVGLAVFAWATDEGDSGSKG